MYSGVRLLELLEQQHQRRGTSDLFKKGTFTLQWRAQVGSFPSPDTETLISAGEPCGAFRPSNGRPEDKRNVGDCLKQLPELPLYGYIPGSSIRGLVRFWAKQRPDIKPRMEELLGYQTDDAIAPGKIEFLDAWPEHPTKLTLDIVNPQQSFQVYHQGQGTPLSCYTLGDGETPISIIVAIRGIPKRTTPEEVEEVWNWVQQALLFYGVGSRTASGYGSFKPVKSVQPIPEPNAVSKTFHFQLYSQGCAGPDSQKNELRPSHWRGWLRSWILRFLLGIMSRENAEKTLGELLGSIGDGENQEAVQGCVRLKFIPSPTQEEISDNEPDFYYWDGRLQITAPSQILNEIVIPILHFAASVGGVGRGWRRPLHVFVMKNGHEASRGSQLFLYRKLRDKQGNPKKRFCYFPIDTPEKWQQAYDNWLASARSIWPSRMQPGANDALAAEVFSPTTCAVYAVPGPVCDPINYQNLSWEYQNPEETRGDGISLAYKTQHPQNYKQNEELGGNAATGQGSSSHCSWVSIRRKEIAHPTEDTDCQEIVCLFLGGVNPQQNHVRARFLADLQRMPGARSLFGL